MGQAAVAPRTRPDRHGHGEQRSLLVHPRSPGPRGLRPAFGQHDRGWSAV